MDSKKAALATMKMALRIIIIALVILLLVYLGRAVFDFGLSVFSNRTMDPPPGRQVTVVVKQGDSSGDVGEMLESKGLVEGKWTFVVREKLSKYSGKIQPGTYTLNTSMPLSDMLAILAGDSAEEEEEDKQE